MDLDLYCEQVMWGGERDVCVAGGGGGGVMCVMGENMWGGGNVWRKLCGGGRKLKIISRFLFVYKKKKKIVVRFTRFKASFESFWSYYWLKLPFRQLGSCQCRQDMCI